MAAAAYLVVLGGAVTLGLPESASLLTSDLQAGMRMFVAAGFALAIVHSLVTLTYGLLILGGRRLANWAAAGAAADLVIRLVGLVALGSVFDGFAPLLGVLLWGGVAASLLVTLSWREVARWRSTAGGVLVVGELFIGCSALLSLAWTLVGTTGLDAQGMVGLLGAGIIGLWSEIAALHVGLAIFWLGAPRTALGIAVVTDLVLGALLLAGPFPLEGAVLLGGGTIVGIALVVGRGRPRPVSG